jgi:hypothetical protein
MAEERAEVALPELTRWLVVAALILAGVALYLWLAPRTAPLARPAAREVVS